MQRRRIDIMFIDGALNISSGGPTSTGGVVISNVSIPPSTSSSVGYDCARDCNDADPCRSSFECADDCPATHSLDGSNLCGCYIELLGTCKHLVNGDCVSGGSVSLHNRAYCCYTTGSELLWDSADITGVTAATCVEDPDRCWEACP